MAYELKAAQSKTNSTLALLLRRNLRDLKHEYYDIMDRIRGYTKRGEVTPSDIQGKRIALEEEISLLTKKIKELEGN